MPDYHGCNISACMACVDISGIVYGRSEDIRNNAASFMFFQESEVFPLFLGIQSLQEAKR